MADRLVISDVLQGAAGRLRPASVPFAFFMLSRLLSGLLPGLLPGLLSGLPLMLVSLLLCCGVAGCDGVAVDDAGEAGAGDAGESVLVVAASSTSEVVGEIAARFTLETGIQVRVSTGASNALAAQILAGVPADVFVSANLEWADAVEEAGRSAERAAWLGNRLVMVVPTGNPAGVRTPADLVDVGAGAGDAYFVAIAGENVPAGRYAEEALGAAGVYERLADERRLLRGQHVRFTLTYVERGEAQAGIVYATDARVSDAVEVAYTFPATSHAPIIYPVLRLGADDESTAGSAGARFYAYLFGETARGVCADHGFDVLRAAASEEDR
jgi:molybdate transport system substrate-binding protein